MKKFVEGFEQLNGLSGSAPKLRALFLGESEANNDNNSPEKAELSEQSTEEQPSDRSD